MKFKLSLRPKPRLLSKTWAGFLVVTIGFTSLTSRTEEDPSKSPEAIETVFMKETLDVFKSNVNSPVIQQIWHSTLRQNFGEPLDLIVGDFYRTSPLLQPIFKAFYDHQSELLEDFVTDQMMNNEIVHEGTSDPRSVKILKLAEEIASELGFTREAIQNLVFSIQKGGSANAYTVSGSPKSLFVSFNEELVNLMTISRLKAVMAHEFGHVISGHVLNGAMMDLVTTLLMDTVTQPTRMSRQQMQSLIKEAPWTSREGRSQGVTQRAAIRENMAQWLSEDGSSSPEMQLRMQAINFLLELEPKVKNQLLVGFLDRLVQGLRTLTAPPEASIKYLQQVQFSLQSGMNAVRFNPEQLITHLRVVDSFISQAQETSCDRISASLVSNDRVAAAMTNLKIGDRSTPAADLKMQIENSIQTFEQVLLRTKDKPGKLASLLTGVSHPPPNMRIWIINQFASYPAIIFANRFLRLVLLENALRSNIVGLDDLVQTQKDLPEEIKTRIAEDRKALAETQISLSIKITELILGYEKRLGKKGARNVRLDNLLQYVMAHQQFLLSEAKMAGEFLQKAQITPGTDSKVALQKMEFFKNYLGAIEAELKQGDPLLAQVEAVFKEFVANASADSVAYTNGTSRLQDIAKSRAPFLGETFSAQSFDPNSLIELRKSVTPEGRVRIPPDCATVLHY